MTKNILFVCKYNRFRSKVAEAFFKRYGNRKKYKAKGAGIIVGGPLDKNQRRVCEQFGIDINNPARCLTVGLLELQDLIVIVADDVPPIIFNNKNDNKKLIVWKIPDDKNHKVSEISRIIKSIEKRVIKLVKELK